MARIKKGSTKVHNPPTGKNIKGSYVVLKDNKEIREEVSFKRNYDKSLTDDLSDNVQIHFDVNY